MALNEKYTLTFDDRLGNTWDLKIIEVGVINTPVSIKAGGTPIIITYRTSDDLFEPVITSEATIELVSDSDLLYKTFFDSSRGKWKLLVIKNGNTYWQGQNTTENYSEPYTINPYNSRVKFSDLGDLDFIYYKNGSNFFTGKRTIAQIILDCTNKLTFNIELTELVNIILNVVNVSQLPIGSRSSLIHTSIDVRAFVKYKDFVAEAMTCMEVLKRIMRAMGCRIFQHESRFYILRIEESANALGNIDYAVDINISGNAIIPNPNQPTNYYYTKNILKTIDNIPLTGITPVGENQDLEISERYDQVVHKFITQEVLRQFDDLIFNNDFQKGGQTYNNTTIFPTHWTVSSDILTQKAAELAAWTNNDNRVQLLMSKNPGFPMAGFIAAQNQAINLTANWSKYYLKPSSTIQDELLTGVELTVDDSLLLNINGQLTKEVDYYAINTSNNFYQNSSVQNAEFWFGYYIKLTYDNGAIYWLDKNPIFPTALGVWKIYQTIVYDKIITPGFDSSASSGSGIEYHTDNIDIQFQSAKFPQDGPATIEIRFYIPRHVGSSYPWNLYELLLDNISVKYISDGKFSDELITTNTTYSIPNTKQNTYEMEVYLGDGPSNYILNSFRHPNLSTVGYPLWTHKYSTWRPASNNVASNFAYWRKFNDTTLRLAKDIFNLIPISKFLTLYQRKIKGDYMGTFGFLDCLEINDGSQIKRYLLLGDSYDIKASIHSVDMQEITSQTLSPLLTTTNSPLYLGPKKKKKIFSNSNTLFSSAKNNMTISNQSSKVKKLNLNNQYPG